MNLFSSTPLRTVPVADDPSHRVHADYKGRLVHSPRAGVETLYDLAKDAFARYGDRHCMAKRVFLGWKVPNKIKHFDDTIIWKTYKQVGDEAHKFGAALRKAGLVPAPPATDLNEVKTPWSDNLSVVCCHYLYRLTSLSWSLVPSRMAIFENTCPDWMVAAIGSVSQSISVV